ncbi:hypothetical protein HK105_207771 [Polyrhizophydium stewartii]|uniref:Gelsolin-like domain-containing protein n=1 Tax=Polyrhizophydium stewartii TaxID=2732419 RepID=A0ABR4MZX0_9FUNG
MPKKQLDISETNIAGLGTELEKQVHLNSAKTAAEWKDVGNQPGTKVWRVENFHIVAWPESDYGRFFSGDSYIVLHTYKKKDSPALFHNVHFWLGLQTSQDEAGTAAYKTVELDDYLHGVATQFREVQGFESDTFLSYFPHLFVSEGGVASGFNHVKPEEYRPRLLQVKGKNNKLIVREVPRTHESLNSGDVFLADTGLIIYQWNGSRSNGQEKNKAMSFANALASERKVGKVQVYDEGDSDATPFWDAIGGRGTVMSADEGGRDSQVATGDRKLYRIDDSTGELRISLVATKTIKRAHFETTDVYIFDAVSEVYVWMGAKATKNEKARGLQLAMRYLVTAGRPTTLPIVRVLEGGESQPFLSMLDP